MTEQEAAEIEAAWREIKAGHDAIGRGLERLLASVKGGVKEGFNGLACTAPPSEHRAAHRPGKPPKISTDPDLQAFVEARIDRLTFAEIAAAVAAHFPPKRRVGRSAIHAWWKKRRRQGTALHRSSSQLFAFRDGPG